MGERDEFGAPAAEPAAIRDIAAAAARVADVERLPVAAHVEVYDSVHDVLQGALAALSG